MISVIKAKIFGGSFYWHSFLSAVVLFVLPFPFYLLASYQGSLPDPVKWYQSTNHGPWRWELPGFTIVIPLVLLFLVAIITGGIRFAMKRNTVDLIRLTALLISIIIFIKIQTHYLFWLID
jgi:hypothetical protein